MTPQQKMDELISSLSRSCGAPLNLENGVCALYIKGEQEAVTLEFPADSSYLFIHCPLGGKDTVDQAAIDLLMRINFEANALRGCWTAIDSYNTIRLCTQQDPLTLDAQQFISLIIGFIALSKDISAALNKQV